MKFLFLPLGALFGFILSRAGATTYDFYAQLFLFENLQLMWVMAVAAGVGAVGFQVLKRLKTNALLASEPLSFKGKAYRRGLVRCSLGQGGVSPVRVLERRSLCSVKVNLALFSQLAVCSWERIAMEYGRVVPPAVVHSRNAQ